MAAAAPTIFLARYLLTMVGPCIEHGALRVAKGRIVEVGPAALLLNDAQGLPIVDFGEAVLMPPMANAHTHLELTHVPRWDASGETGRVCEFIDWLLKLIGVLRGVPLEEYRFSLADGMTAVMRCGTGAVGDILSRISARGVYRKSPLRGRLFLEGLGIDPDRCRASLDILEKTLREDAPGAMEYGLAPHAPYTLSRDFFRQLSDLATRLSLPQSMHVAESPAESTLLMDGSGAFVERFYPRIGWGRRIPPASGKTPVEWALREGMLHPGDLLVHGVQVSAKDIDAIASRGLYVVLCPRSNDRLGVGKAPVGAYRAAGVPLLLGTDSLASCDSLSLWDEVAYARRNFAGQLDPPALLRMATFEGAIALGLEGEMGALAPGYGAHFQVLKPSRLPGIAELDTFLCEPGRSDEVQALYLDGKSCIPAAGSL